MSVESFVPEVWVARILVALRARTIYASPVVVNRDYEGEIADGGDTVTINTVGRPTVSDYVPGSTTITPEAVVTAARKLTVDQMKHFAVAIDDVDAAQAKGGSNLLSLAADEAAFELRDVADTFVAGLYTQAAEANQLGTVTIDSPDDAYGMLVDLRTKLTRASVPTEGRYVIVEPWIYAFLLRDDRFIDYSKSGTTQGLREGQVGRAAGFEVYESVNAPSLDSGDDNIVLAGYPGAITFADQVVKMKAYEPEDSFSDAVKGLHVYGAKVIRPEGLATCQASQS
ncbi:MAG: P22 phage major capsid protein family protein [Actinomycetota bacterium]|nr:P22 phage major capsid protein family protein [Actinomycetota bacterium]